MHPILPDDWRFQIAKLTLRLWTVRRVGESSLALEPRMMATGSFLNSQTTSGIGLPSTWHSRVTDWPSYPTLDNGIETRGGAAVNYA